MTVYSLDVLLSQFGTICCSMASSNCCFLTCIQVAQEAGQVVWYSHLFQNFPQFVVIHAVKGYVLVKKSEIDVFLELSCFFDDPSDVGNFISAFSTFQLEHLEVHGSRTVVCLLSSVQSLSRIWLFATHGLQHARPPCPSPAPGVYSNSCPLSWWCHPTISSSVVPFSLSLQSFPVSGSFQMS